MISDYDRAHVGDILAGDGTWFTAHLLRLCARADAGNLERLRLAFPDVVEAFLSWRDGRPAPPRTIHDLPIAAWAMREDEADHEGR